MTIETGNCAFVRGKINRLCFWDWLNSSNPKMLESTPRRYNFLTVKILLACFPPALIVKSRIALINYFTLLLIQPPTSCFKNKGRLSNQDGSSSFISSVLLRSVYKVDRVTLALYNSYNHWKKIKWKSKPPFPWKQKWNLANAKTGHFSFWFVGRGEEV